MKKYIFILAAFLQIFLISSELSAQIDEIRSKYKDGLLEQSLVLIENLKDYSIDAQIIKAQILKDLYRFDEAIEVLKKADKIKANNVKILTDLANLYRVNGENKNSLEFFDRAAKLEPGNIVLKIELANAKYLNDLIPEAISEYYKIYLSDTNNLYIIKRLATSYIKMNNVDSSSIYLKKCLNANPKDINSELSLCSLLIANHLYKEALQETELYLANDPNEMRIVSLNAYCNVLVTNYRVAINKYLKCIESGDTSKAVNKYLGISFYYLEVNDSAEIYLEKAFKQDTTDFQTGHFLGIALRKTMKYEKSIYYLERTVDILSFYHDEYAQAYRNMFESAKLWPQITCEKQLEVSIKSYDANPHDKMIPYYLAMGYENCSKSIGEAIEYYEKYIKVNAEELKKKKVDRNLQINAKFSKFKIEALKKKRNETD
jgi:tetratricopeptide (TPR) repeat protein